MLLVSAEHADRGERRVERVRGRIVDAVESVRALQHEPQTAGRLLVAAHHLDEFFAVQAVGRGNWQAETGNERLVGLSPLG